MILQIIKLKSELPEEELLKRAKEREPSFESISGLLQKYYVKTTVEGEYGGVYVWDSMESMKRFAGEQPDLGADADRFLDTPETTKYAVILTGPAVGEVNATRFRQWSLSLHDILVLLKCAGRLERPDLVRSFPSTCTFSRATIVVASGVVFFASTPFWALSAAAAVEESSS